MMVTDRAQSFHPAAARSCILGASRWAFCSSLSPYSALDKPYCERPEEKGLKSPPALTSTSKSHSAVQEPQRPFPGSVPWPAVTRRGRAEHPHCPLSPGTSPRALTTLRHVGVHPGQCQQASFVFISLENISLTVT